MNDDNGVAMAEAIRHDIELKIETKPIIFSGKMVIVRQGILENEILKLKKESISLLRLAIRATIP